jgi:hypothetical protein
MQDDKNTTDTPIKPTKDSMGEPPTLTFRIAKTTYNVRVHFSRTSRETVGDKISRLIKMEILCPVEATDSAPDPSPDKKDVPRTLTAGKEKPT